MLNFKFEMIYLFFLNADHVVEFSFTWDGEGSKFCGGCSRLEGSTFNIDFID